MVQGTDSPPPADKHATAADRRGRFGYPFAILVLLVSLAVVYSAWSEARQRELKLAEAEGTRLENEALRGTGSEAMVGLKMAEALKGTRVIIVPTDGQGGMNPLDLNGALKRFDVKE